MIRRRLLLSLCGTVLVASNVHAQTIASTSFENETVIPNAAYTDPATDGTTLPLGELVDIVNLVDYSPVESTDSSAMAGDLGFTAVWRNTRADVGLSDGDFVGVADFTGTVGAYTDGVQGYQMSDLDGAMDVTFDAVDLTGQSNVMVSLDYFIQSTGYETDPADLFKIEVLTDAGSFTILDTTGSDIDDLGIEDTWLTGTMMLPDSATTATLVVTADTNAGAEAIYLDNVQFRAVPEPGSMVVLMGLAFAGRWRRRAGSCC